MEATHCSPVSDLSTEQRQIVESMIGRPLETGQVVFWLVVQPRYEPSAGQKLQARSRLSKLFNEIDLRAEGQIAADDAEAAIDAAVRDIRSGSP